MRQSQRRALSGGIYAGQDASFYTTGKFLKPDHLNLGRVRAAPATQYA